MMHVHLFVVSVWFVYFSHNWLIFCIIWFLHNVGLNLLLYWLISCFFCTNVQVFNSQVIMSCQFTFMVIENCGSSIVNYCRRLFCPRRHTSISDCGSQVILPRHSLCPSCRTVCLTMLLWLELSMSDKTRGGFILVLAVYLSMLSSSCGMTQKEKMYTIYKSTNYTTYKCYWLN